MVQFVRAHATGNGLPVRGTQTGNGGRRGFRFPSRRVFCTASTRFAELGDTLVSVQAPVGAVNMASERCAVGRGVAAILAALRDTLLPRLISGELRVLDAERIVRRCV